MKQSKHSKNKQDRAAQAALFVSAAGVPNSFQKSLMPRDAKDQGVVTGLSMAVNYGIIGFIRRSMEEAADQLAGTKQAKDDDYKSHVRQRRFGIALDSLLLGTTLYAEKRLEQPDQESTLRDVGKTGARWLKYAAIAGLATGVMQEVFEITNKPKDEKGNKKITRFPVGVFGGTLLAAFTALRRKDSFNKAKSARANTIDVAESIGIGLGVLGALSAVNFGQRKVADEVSDEMEKLLPGSQNFWWSASHTAAVAATGLAIVALMRRVYHHTEEVAAKIEDAYLKPPTSSLASGGPASVVSWESLSVQGRRFAGGAITKKQINQVLGAKDAIEPVRVFVGLDSAPTEHERVELALDELERTGAFSRELIMLVSPTGTGYVNYVAVEAAELMSRGNMASVALQYSKRPSPMSLDRVPEGRMQFKMLLKAITKRIERLPKSKRPRLVLFGESLGAWTSQDAFVGQGTDGLIHAGVDRALWIGSPYGSKWKTEVLGPPRPDVEPALVGKFDNINELKSLNRFKRNKLRYVMISHYNDAVTLFGGSLIYKKPDWLDDPEKRPPTVPKTQQYTSPGTFLLTLMDMKNSMKVNPGQFEASGHDYRADLAEFVKAVYGFSINRQQMVSVEQFLRQNEVNRAERLNSKKAD